MPPAVVKSGLSLWTILSAKVASEKQASYALHMKKLIPLLLCALLVGCDAPTKETVEAPEPPPTMEWAEFAQSTMPDIWIGGQPSDDAIQQFVSKGGRLVINLRTDDEMDFYPYYDGLLAGRDLKYVRIPTSGADLDAAEYDALTEALEGHEGPVMLHCRSGKRATYLWAMRRIAVEGLSADQAAKWCETRRGKAWEEGTKILQTFEADLAKKDG